MSGLAAAVRRNAPGLAVLAVALVVAVIFRGKLVRWFTGADDPPGPRATSPAGHDHGSSPEAGDGTSSPPALPAQRFPEDVLAALSEAFVAYEQARDLLAHDRRDGLPEAARRIADSLRQAETALGATSPHVADCLEDGAEAAGQLGGAETLEAARESFQSVSRFLMALALADPRLAEGRHVFSCPMVHGFNRWIQESPDIENPYMGQAMPACGSRADWTLELPSADPVDPSDIAWYTCPMHPSVKQAVPGTCPICAMDLTPVSRSELETGTVRVDAQRRQAIGVRTDVVRRRPLSVEIRATGRVTWDESAVTDVTLKFDGFIRDLLVDQTGQAVRRGQTLFTIYSPELLTAQQEYLAALASQRSAAGTSAPGRVDTLVRAARRRLELWDVPASAIADIQRRGTPLEAVPVASPASGHVVEKDVRAGSAVQAGMLLYRIAALDPVWVEAQVYENELPLVEVGQRAQVVLPYAPDAPRDAEVTFVYPWLDEQTRTGRVRLELPNPDGALKPDMYANVLLARDLGEVLAVPESAVLHAGRRRVVFLDLGDGRLQPKEVQLGARAGDWFEVRGGLDEGDVVVTSANFLVAAESRLKSALEQWQ